MRRFGIGFLAVGMLLSGCRRDVSGTYLAGDKGTVLWLQLVRTPDNHLSGQLAASTVGQDGAIEQNAAPVTGAVDGNNVTVSVSRLLGLSTMTLGGANHGDKLILSGADGATEVWRRAELPEYQQRLVALKAQSEQAIAAKKAADVRAVVASTHAELLSEMSQTVDKMQRFEAEADLHLAKIPGAESRYRDLTSRMIRDVSRERQLSNSDASVARSQLDVDVNQASVATNQLHLEAQQLERTFEINIKPIADQATRFEQGCRNVPAPSFLTPAQIDGRNGACQRLLAADPAFRQKYAATQTGLDQLEQVYSQEYRTQQDLLQTAERLQ